MGSEGTYVESDDGSVQPDISFGDVFAKVVWAGVGREVFLNPIESREKRADIVLVSFLSAV